MTEEDYDELMRLRERFLAANDEEKVGEGRDQRAMGLGELQENLPALYNSRFKFTGKNAEEFLSKFRHACEAMKVTRIFYEDYGLHKPNMNDPTYPTWSADDSRAFRLLERHLDSDIWSALRDGTDKTARQVFDLLDRAMLRGTVRTTAKIQQEMENVKMGPNDTLASHFGEMCSYFRRLHQSGHNLTDAEKIVKSMHKMNQRWIDRADEFIATRDELTFDEFRIKMLQLEISSDATAKRQANEAAFAATDSINFHSSNGSGKQQDRHKKQHKGGRGGRGRYQSKSKGNREHSRDRESSSEDNGKVRCSKCCGFGHTAGQCPSKNSQSRCFICFKTGHGSKSCPEKSGKKNSAHVHHESKESRNTEGFWMVAEKGTPLACKSDCFNGSHENILVLAFYQNCGGALGSRSGMI